MKLRVLQWNIRRFAGNIPFIQTAIADISPDIICFQEANASSYNRLHLAGYLLSSRKDRIDRNGGGVTIHVKPTVPYITLKCDTQLEATAIRVPYPTKNFYTLLFVSGSWCDIKKA